MNWILKRAARSVFTVVLVVNLSFFLINLLPGGPIDFIRAQMAQGGGRMTAGEIEAMTQAYLNLNPKEPLTAQYVDYMSALIHGNLGKSVYLNEPVAQILSNALPWTIFLMFNAIVIMFGIGITFGALLAYLEGSRFDNAGTVFSIVSNSIPYYVVGILLLFFFSNNLGWFPVSGKYNGFTTPGVNYPFIAGVLNHSVLPILSFVFAGIGGWALSMRGNSIRVLGEDYLRVGRLRGLPTHRLTLQYVGRNAILPLYTQMLISVGYLFGGSVVLEQIFGYRGIGYYLFQGVESRDYQLMMGGFILITTAVVVALFIAELSYGKLDPRVSEGGTTGESY